MTRRRLLLHAIVQTLLVLAIAITANHVASQAWARLDVTRDQRHTLSAVTRQAARALDRPLVVRVFYSEGLGPDDQARRRRLLDLLDEIGSHASGRLRIEPMDPDDTPGHRAMAEELGLEPADHRSRRKGAFVAREIFRGVALLYGDQVQVLDDLVAPERYEYRLARSLRALTTPRSARPVVGYTVGHGEVDLGKVPDDSPLGRLSADLRDRADLRPVPLGKVPEISPDIDLLLVNGPVRPVSTRAQYQLDQFLMSGRPVAAFIRGIRPDFRTGRAQIVRHDLYGLMGHYGVQLNRDMVLDRDRNEAFAVPVRRGGRTRRVAVPYPPIPTTRKLDDGHPVTTGVDRAVLPFVTSLDLADPLPSGVQGEGLVSTETSSARVEGILHVRPDAFKTPIPEEEDGSWPVVVSLRGRFSSYFVDQPIPPPPGIDPATWSPDPTSKIVDASPTRLLVAGSADMLANNPTLVLNAVDWLLDDTALLEIRTRTARDPRFDPPAATTAWTLKAVIVGVPLALLYGIGGIVWVAGRSRR